MNTKLYVGNLAKEVTADQLNSRSLKGKKITVTEAQN